MNCILQKASSTHFKNIHEHVIPAKRMFYSSCEIWQAIQQSQQNGSQWSMNL